MDGRKLAHKKRGNPTWGKLCANPAPDMGTAFGSLVERLGLSDKPGEWAKSRELKLFAQRFHKSRYVPENLLEVWGIAYDFNIIEV